MTTRALTSRGFTIIELMVVLAIAAILAAAAIPSMTEIVRRNTQESVINDLAGALAFARSEAINRGQKVSVCQSANGTSCATSGDWTAGWIVFVDPVDPTAPSISAVVDANEQILRVHPPVPTSITKLFLREGLTAGDVVASIRFDRTGFLSTKAPSQGVFTVCRDTDASHAQGLLINTAGRVSVAADSNGDGIPNLSTSENLSCI